MNNYGVIIIILISSVRIIDEVQVKHLRTHLERFTIDFCIKRFVQRGARYKIIYNN